MLTENPDFGAKLASVLVHREINFKISNWTYELRRFLVTLSPVVLFHVYLFESRHSQLR